MLGSPILKWIYVEEDAAPVLIQPWGVSLRDSCRTGVFEAEAANASVVKKPTGVAEPSMMLEDLGWR